MLLWNPGAVKSPGFYFLQSYRFEKINDTNGSRMRQNVTLPTVTRGKTFDVTPLLYM